MSTSARSVSGLTSAISGSPTLISTKLVSVRTSSDLPMKTGTVAVRLPAPIWITRSACAVAVPMLAAKPDPAIRTAAIIGRTDQRLLST